MDKRLRRSRVIIFLICLSIISIWTFAGCEKELSSPAPAPVRHFDIKTLSFLDNPPAQSLNSITLKWEAPLVNVNGAPLNDLAGYKVYYGTPRSYRKEPVNMENVTSIRIYNLSSGTWCFAVKAYDISGNESDFSDQVCKNIE